MRKSLSVAYQPAMMTLDVDYEHQGVQDILNNKAGCVDTTFFNGSTCWKDIENIKSTLQGNPPSLSATVNWLDNQTNTVDIRCTDFYKNDTKLPSTPFASDVLTMQPSCVLKFIPQGGDQWKFQFTFDYRNVDSNTISTINNNYSGINSAVLVKFNGTDVFSIDTVESFRIYTHEHNFTWNQTDTLTVVLVDKSIEDYNEQQVIYTIRTL